MSQPSTQDPRGATGTSRSTGWVLGLMLAVQVGALGWAMLRPKPPATPVVVAPPAPAPTAPAATTPLQAAPLPPVAPLDFANAEAEILAKAATTNPMAAAPVAPTQEAPKAPQAGGSLDVDITNQQVLFWLEKGLSSRESGDTKSAAAQLRAACDIQPGHPRLLHELATTYELMALPDKAKAVWDEIFKLGPEAGPYYVMAQGKFSDGIGTRPSRDLESPIRLGQIISRKETSPLAKDRVTVRVPVTAQLGALVDPSKVSVLVQFYDNVPGSGIEETVADTHEQRWLSAGGRPTWTSTTTEHFDITYHLPRSSLASSTPETRSYYGQVIKLYYNDQLQDVSAEPKELALRESERSLIDNALFDNSRSTEVMPGAEVLDGIPFKN